MILYPKFYEGSILPADALEVNANRASAGMILN